MIGQIRMTLQAHYRSLSFLHVLDISVIVVQITHFRPPQVIHPKDHNTTDCFDMVLKRSKVKSRRTLNISQSLSGQVSNARAVFENILRH